MTTTPRAITNADGLNTFVHELPYVRRPILRFVRNASRLLPPGSRILDAGCGDAPYRTLFAHCQYLTADSAATDYHNFSKQKPDIICDIAHIPLEDGSLDAILCTEVLEHVPEPALVLAEFRRLLRPSGHLFLTVPLIWEVHEEPYDFYRYTPYSLGRLLSQAGFSIEFIRARHGRFWTLAHFVDEFGRQLQLQHFEEIASKLNFPVPKTVCHLGHKFSWLILCHVVTSCLARLDLRDRQRTFTLGYVVHCTIPLHSCAS
jgi:SAM-dependent methyltransferase